MSEGEVSAEWGSRLCRGSKVASVGGDGTGDSNFLQVKDTRGDKDVGGLLGESLRWQAR
jgi:hypothetical protein